MDPSKNQLSKEKKPLQKNKKVNNKNFKEFWNEGVFFIKQLFNIRNYSDKEFTRQTILENIPFRGHTAWLLIFSIMIASVGLNANSTPVVIGAMLISPLMGPIMGAGFAIGTNDIDTFRKSAINYFVMVVLSIFTSFIYFKISPLAYESSELLARTSPTFFDVMIAFFGGLAGIVAITKKGFFNVISGVAIATALMPPLCTAGFGLATGNLAFFTGAMYLLLINSFFIALATFLIIKYLGFPVAHYLNSSKSKRISRIIYVLAFLVTVPSILSFIKMYNEEIFKRSAADFIQKNIKYEGTQIVKINIKPEQKKLDVYLIGEIVPNHTIKMWKSELHKNPNLKEAVINVYQSADNTKEIEQSLSEKLKGEIFEKLFTEKKEILKNKDEQIKRLTNELIRLKQIQEESKIPFTQISQEVKKLFPNIKQIGFSQMIETNFKKVDTIPTFIIQWQKKLSGKQKENKKLRNWLKIRLKLDTLKLINF